MAVLIYLLQVSLCAALLVLFYRLLLKDTSFFRANRAFLILSLVISFIVPAVDVTLERTAEIKTEQLGLETEEHAIARNNKRIDVISESSLDIEKIFLCGYALIASMVLLKDVFGIAKLLLRARRADEKCGKLKIYYGLKGLGNSSFFNLIFIEDRQLTELQKSVIVIHEGVHAQKGHSADKLFMLVCRAILWFNPLLYVYENELEKVHEFEADLRSAANVGTRMYAQCLVELAIERKRNYPVHALSTHPLKLRISMLLAPKSSTSLRGRYLLAIPLLMGFIALFSVKIVYAKQIDTGFVLVADASHGGRDKGITLGSASEKEIVLDIAKRIQQRGALAGIKVLLTRNDDRDLMLKQRAKMNGGLLISLHVDSASKEQKGIRMLTGNKSPIVNKQESIFLGILQGQFSMRSSGLKIDKDVTPTPQLYLLREYKAASVVLELGNLNNDSDRALLLTTKGREAIAENIVASVVAYSRQAKSK